MQLLLQNPNASLGNRLVTLWQLREATGTKIENDSIHMLSTHNTAKMLSRTTSTTRRVSISQFCPDSFLLLIQYLVVTKLYTKKYH